MKSSEEKVLHTLLVEVFIFINIFDDDLATYISKNFQNLKSACRI